MTDQWLDAGSPTTRLPSAAGAKLAARARAAAAALTAAAARIPAAEARARDDASPLGAASYDHPIVGGSRSELWCWHHQRPVTACQHDDLLCTGEPVPVGDPTGEAAIRRHDDHAHQARAALAKVEAGVAALLDALAAATAPPSGPGLRALRDTAKAEVPGCRWCARVPGPSGTARWWNAVHPGLEAFTAGGTIPAVAVCRSCYEFHRTRGREPSKVELVEKRDTGKWPKVHEQAGR